MIFCNVNIDFENVETVPKTKYMIDYRKFGELLDNKRIVLDESLNSSDLCRQLIEILSLAEQECSTTSTENVNIKHKIMPWLTDAVMSLYRYKDNLLKLRRKEKGKFDINERLKRISKVIRNCDRTLKEGYFKFNINKCNGNLRKVWNFLDQQLGKKKKESKDILTETNGLLTSDKEKASCFNNYFYDVVHNLRESIDISHASNNDINLYRTLVPATARFNLNCVNAEYMENVLNKLGVHKSPGSDKITTSMLLTRKPMISRLLSVIFNKMIRECNFPDVLKNHKIFPIPKTAGTQMIQNFRPISILSVIGKVFEINCIS